MKNRNLFRNIAGSLLAIAAFAPLQAAVAEVPEDSYELLVVVNRAFGDLIVKGQYQRAIDRIGGSPNVYPFATATNLCAAYGMLGDLDRATPYCDEALERAEKAANSGRRKGNEEMTGKWAHAYSNRGVVRVLRGDEAGAEEDFRMAIELRADMHAPTHNFALLHLETTEPVATIKH